MSKLTPMMEQYFDIKKDYKHCLLFYRLGDFYELFYDDAITASKELDITLTGRDCGQKDRAPMCGVPYHSVDGYIAQLVEKGYKVAICEQVEDASQTKKIVNRKVVRVVTAGTVLDSNMLDEGKNNYLVCIYENKSEFGLSYADITTGEFYTTQFSATDEKRILDEIARLNPKEIIINDCFRQKDFIEKAFNIKPTVYYAWFFEYKYAYKKICEHFGVLNLKGLGLEDDINSVCASGALLEYLLETQKNSLNHIFSIKKYSQNKYLLLDASSRRNLELTETLRDKSKKGSLLWVLDKTKTPMGARLLRKWIQEPLVHENDINKRLDAVEEFKDDVLIREELKEFLNTIYDFERLLSKIAYKTANGRDILNLKKSFQYFPNIKFILGGFKKTLNTELFNTFDELTDIYELIDEAICEEPPFSVREGGIFKTGYNETLDKYHQAKNEGSNWLLELEAKEKEETGIKNLKIRYNKVFGYYIEVTNSYKHLAPERYIRRQTLANCERYTIAELKEIEDAIVGADEKIAELEYKLFMEIIEKITSELERIQFASYVIATIDVLQSLAEVADKNNYVKPIINNKGFINIVDGRHPVVEKLADETFVPNDTCLDLDENRLSIITGPNMAGKSTFMRQTAIIVLMAQIGSFIPAESGEISIVDKIFTRVGASDDLAMGQSTFMVEMSEVANILNNATANSLIILDEIGRGTSTFDGLSIAWSVLEYIAAKIGAKTLFATHYHELTELEGKITGVKNYCVSVKERGDDIIFLRKIIRGGSDNSYGIHVAKLAGVPYIVLERAREILQALDDADIAKGTKDSSNEVVYYSKKKSFDCSKYKLIINEIAEMDVDTLTPRDALKKLYDLQNITKDFKKEEES